MTNHRAQPNRSPAPTTGIDHCLSRNTGFDGTKLSMVVPPLMTTTYGMGRCLLASGTPKLAHGNSLLPLQQICDALLDRDARAPSEDALCLGAIREGIAHVAGATLPFFQASMKASSGMPAFHKMRFNNPTSISVFGTVIVCAAPAIFTAGVLDMKL
jgi:hypothetical protein